MSRHTLILASCLTLALACASTQGASGFRGYSAHFSVAYDAAVHAMRAVGAEVIQDNPGGGFVTGLVRGSTKDMAYRINAAVRRSAAGQDGTPRGSDVSVSVTVDGTDEPSPAQARDLADLSDRYLETLDAMLVDWDERRRPSTGPPTIQITQPRRSSH